MHTPSVLVTLAFIITLPLSAQASNSHFAKFALPLRNYSPASEDLRRNPHSLANKVLEELIHRQVPGQFTQDQVVTDICNANPQNDFDNCYDTLNPHVTDSRNDYCSLIYNRLAVCQQSYPGDNGLAECPDLQQEYDTCDQFAYRIYEFCLQYGYSSLNFVVQCANVELQVRPQPTPSLSGGNVPIQTAGSISTDGTCGFNQRTGNAVTCVGSGFGQCCGQGGVCGQDALACGRGCQPQYGFCSPSNPDTSSSSGITLTTTTSSVTTLSTTTTNTGSNTNTALPTINSGSSSTGTGTITRSPTRTTSIAGPPTGPFQSIPAYECGPDGAIHLTMVPVPTNGVASSAATRSTSNNDLHITAAPGQVGLPKGLKGCMLSYGVEAIFTTGNKVCTIATAVYTLPHRQ